MSLFSRRNIRAFNGVVADVLRVACLFSAILILIGTTIALCRTILIEHRLDVKLGGRPEDTRDVVDESRIMKQAERLAGALKIPTISYKTDHQETKAFLALHEYLQKSFPVLHSHPAVKREIVNELSLLYTIQGTKSGALPYLLASHLDVVPVNEKGWLVPPFGGFIVNGTYIYGRGAMDDKCGVMGILEALEYLLQQGERPHRTFFLAFGHDEEVSGKRGAQEIAKLLKNRGINELDFVLDEGFPISDDLTPGTSRPVAMVGVSEKGTATLELSVFGTPGHSSFPPAETPIGVLSAGLARLEQRKFKSMFGSGPEKQMFEHLAPHVTFMYKLLYSNLWFFGPLMESHMATMPVTNAFLRTTTAITMFQAGVKENIVPQSATAVVNFRIHPAQTVNDVLEFTREVIADARIQIKIKRSREAHPISPHGPYNVPYQLISTSIRQVYRQAIVVPAVFIANTDTRWYLDFSTNIYRFLPTLIKLDDIGRYHGHNERMAVVNYHHAVNFYYRIMKNADLALSKEYTTQPFSAEL
ncbi:hypothetical protein ONE63_005721 [Megalurothrips usitatus]|uniref:Peptidase M20 dimerisation domain-containing protein n=1 Tax=Megalurothrips usitatus TaxID=439358 RepID=A0AAV7Y3P7_9NEOP|nr:hypothetical protein ONE63_005721 [Megalurothrips usitatus]